MDCNQRKELFKSLYKVLDYIYDGDGESHIQKVRDTSDGIKATLIGYSKSEIEDVSLSFDDKTGAFCIVNQCGENLLEPSSTERWSEKEMDYFRFGKEYPLQPVEPTKEMDYELEME